MCLVAPALQMADCMCEYLESKSVLFILRTAARVSSSAVFWLAQMALNFLSHHWSKVSSSSSWKQQNISCFLFGLNVALNPDWTLTVPEVVFAGAHINLMFTLSSLSHRHGSSQELLLELVMLAQGQSHLKCLCCSADTTKATRAKHLWTRLVFLILT